MAEPTAGEWGASGTMVVTPPPGESQRRIRDREFPFTSKRICLADPSPYIPQAEAEANTRLIAAVKDLLEACRLLVRENLPYAELKRSIAVGYEAIEKATGQPTPEPAS
jgi:hypothetical protein